MSSDAPAEKTVKEQVAEEPRGKKFSPMELAMISRVNQKDDGDPVLTEAQMDDLAHGTYDARTFYWGTKLSKLGFRDKKRADDRMIKYLRDPVKNRSEVMQMIIEADEKYVLPDIHAAMRYMHILTEVLRMKGIDITNDDFTAARMKLEDEAKKKAEEMLAEAKAKAEEDAKGVSEESPTTA